MALIGVERMIPAQTAREIETAPKIVHSDLLSDLEKDCASAEGADVQCEREDQTVDVRYALLRCGNPDLRRSRFGAQSL